VQRSGLRASARFLQAGVATERFAVGVERRERASGQKLASSVQHAGFAESSGSAVLRAGDSDSSSAEEHKKAQEGCCPGLGTHSCERVKGSGQGGGVSRRQCPEGGPKPTRASTDRFLLIVEGMGNTGKPLNGMPGAFEPTERYPLFSLCKAG